MILVDTGPIVATASKRDEHHASCPTALSGLREPPLITSLVVMEVCYFLSTRASPTAEAPGDELVVIPHQAQMRNRPQSGRGVREGAGRWRGRADGLEAHVGGEVYGLRAFVQRGQDGSRTCRNPRH